MNRWPTVSVPSKYTASNLVRNERRCASAAPRYVCEDARRVRNSSRISRSSASKAFGSLRDPSRNAATSLQGTWSGGTMRGRIVSYSSGGQVFPSDERSSEA